MENYIITAIVKSPAGVSVRIERGDEGEEYLISEKVFRGLSYTEGCEISCEEAESLRCEAEYLRAAARTLKILSYSSHSKSALVRKLCHYGFDREIAIRAADSAEEAGDLDEKRQAAQLCDYYIRHKYWGKKRIAAELMSRGYGKEAVLHAIASAEDERFARNLGRLVENKPVPEDKEGRDRYIASLARMGYSVQEILRAIDEV